MSVSLPTWDDVIGYEEREARVVDAMKTGYPRFFINPTVADLSARILSDVGEPDKEGCYLFPSITTAITMPALKKSRSCSSWSSD